MAFLLEDEDTPVVWRGPIKLGAIQQFIGDVEWGNLDYLIIDFPPGTSDEPLTVAQSLPDIDGMVIVTTPQDVALLDSRKSISFASSLKVPVLGVVENMSGYTIQGKGTPGSDIEIAHQLAVPCVQRVMMKDDSALHWISSKKEAVVRLQKNSAYLSLALYRSIQALSVVETMAFIVL